MNPGNEPEADASSEISHGGFERLLRFLLPGVAAISLVAFMLAQRISIDRDLRIVAPAAVAPGQAFPVRALLYADLRAVEGARLVAEPVRVRLLDGDGHPLAGAKALQLKPGFRNTLEGIVTMPEGARGPVRLRAEHADGSLATDIVVRAVPGPKSLVLLPRSVRPLQRLSLGPPRVEVGQVAPSALSVAVGGGGCVPEYPCHVFIYVGSPAAAVTLPASGSLTVSRQPGGGPTSGVRVAEVIVHGPEANMEVRAHRGGVLVARRQVRLPVLLGVPALSLAEEPGQRGQLRLMAEPGPCIVDLFQGGRRLASATVAECSQRFALPRVTAPLSAEPLRVQVRRDPFAATSAAVRVLDGRPVDDPTRIAGLTTDAAANRADDPLVRACSRDPSTCAGDRPDLAARYLLAVLEDGIVSVPTAASGQARAIGRLAKQKAWVRTATFLSLGLCGVTLALLVARRGLRGGVQARAWMVGAEDRARLQQRARRRSWLMVSASVAALLLAFVAVALYVAARDG